MSLLNNKLALVVGIANDRSYAFHIAKSLKDHGAKLAFTHLPGEKNERRTRRAIDELGISDPWLVSMDAGSDADMDAVFTKLGSDFERLDILVHSIAFADREWLEAGKFVSTPRQAFMQALDISAYSLIAMSARARPLMARGAGGGSIMAMSYYGGEKVVPGYNVMGVAKSALESTARYLAWELGAEKIRVNIISGGYLRTLASSAVGGTDTMGDHVEKKAPLRRNVEGADVGRTAVYLASELASGVSGETIYVDCGVNIVGL